VRVRVRVRRRLITPSIIAVLLVVSMTYITRQQAVVESPAYRAVAQVARVVDDGKVSVNHWADMPKVIQRTVASHNSSHHGATLVLAASALPVATLFSTKYDVTLTTSSGTSKACVIFISTARHQILNGPCSS